MPQAIATVPSAYGRMQRGSEVKRQWDQWAASSHPELDYTTMYGPYLAEQESLQDQYIKDRQFYEERRRYQEQLDLQRQQMAEQAAANQISGYTQVATSAANLYGPGKNAYATVKGWIYPEQATTGTTTGGGAGMGEVGPAFTEAPAVNTQPATPVAPGEYPPSTPDFYSPTPAESAREIAMSNQGQYGTAGPGGTVAQPVTSSSPVATSVSPSSSAGPSYVSSSDYSASMAAEMGYEGGGSTAAGESGSLAASEGAGGAAAASPWGTFTPGNLLGATAWGYTAYSVADMLQKTHTGQEINDAGARMNRALGGPELSNESFAAGGRGAAAGAAAGAYLGPFAIIGALLGGLIGAGWRSVVREGEIPGIKMPGTGWHIVPTIKFKGAEGRKTMKYAATKPHRALGRIF